MIFSSSKASPQGQRAVPARLAVCLAAAALAFGLASCGGGTSQYDAFVPQRLLVFGDENSTITQNGRKYAVNGLDANGAVDCNSEGIWVQQLAASYGFIFDECNPTAANTQARMRAAAGAKVADVTAQVEAQVAAGGFRDKDLATVLAGTNDVLELYAQFPGQSEAQLAAQARARGLQLAQVVNRLVGLGVKVIVSDLPDLGLTPYAAEQNTLTNNADRSGLLSRLTTAFNEQLGVNVVLDGRYVGLVQAQLRFQAIGRSPGSFGLTDNSRAICTVPLPNCTTATLLEGTTAGQSVWASDIWLSTGGHVQLASLAIDRARRNPF